MSFWGLPVWWGNKTLAGGEHENDRSQECPTLSHQLQIVRASVMLSTFIVHLNCPRYFLRAVIHLGVSKETVHILAVSSWHLHLDILTKITMQVHSLRFEVFYINLAFGFMGDWKWGSSLPKPRYSQNWRSGNRKIWRNTAFFPLWQLLILGSY